MTPDSLHLMVEGEMVTLRRVVWTSALIAFKATLLLGCTSTRYEETASSVIIKSGSGGLVKPILERYSRWASRDVIIIDGHLASADAFAALALKNSCYTENAKISLHAAS